jgi:ribokinase
MKVLTVGGAMIDTVAVIDSARIERMSMRNADSSFLLLEEGRKTEAEDISTHVGGGGINAAVALARLGLDTAAVAKLGRDARAETILNRLMDEGVSTRYVVRDSRAPTGASVIISAHERNAAVFTFRGANTLLEPPDLRDDAFAVDLVFISNLSNKSADCFPSIVRCAKSHGALVATNPGIRQLSARGGPFMECLPLIDILSINRAEAEVLVPSLIARFGEGGPPLPLAADEEAPELELRGLVGGGFQMSLSAFLYAVRGLGVANVLLTDGGGGAFLKTPDRIIHCPALRLDHVASTAGAGDAFSATFAAYVALGREPEEALRAATLNAASVVGHVDTQTGLLKREALDQRLTAEAERLPVRQWKA